jgi:hypothetical protein
LTTKFSAKVRGQKQGTDFYDIIIGKKCTNVRLKTHREKDFFLVKIVLKNSHSNKQPFSIF